MEQTDHSNRPRAVPRERAKMPILACLTSFRQVLLFGLMLAAVSLPRRPVRAADADTAKHEVKLNAHEGDRWDFDMTRKTDLTVAGQHTVEQANSSRRKGTEQVLEVKDGRPIAVRITYDKESTTTNPGQPAEQPFPLAGKAITVRRDEAGKVTSDAGPLDAGTAQEVMRFVDPDTSLYPAHAVSVGEEWPGDNAALAKEFQLRQGDQISLKCKLQGIGKVDGRPTADIFSAGSVVKNEQGIITHIDLSGVTQVDLATGKTLQSDIMEKIGIKGSRDGPNPDGAPVTVQASGTLEVHQTVRPANTLAAGHTDNPPHTGSDFPAPDAVPGGHGEAGPFVGTFKDDALTAEFHPAGDGLAGTLTLHDKKFPATARIDDGKLVGTFEADGDKFDFAASVEGNVMILKSGSKSYTLKKPAENPLDPGGEHPKARNPLDVQN